MDKPDVDFIEGLSPAVSIDQKSTNRNPRSTVGTITEVYDYLRLLFARAGTQYCPVCGEKVTAQTPQQIVDRLLELPEGTRYQVLAPVVRGRKGEYADLFKELQAKGFSRARVDGEVVPAHRPARAGEEAQARHRGRRRPPRVARRRAAPAHRLRRDRARPGGGLVMVELVDADIDDPDANARFSENRACPNDHTLALDEIEPRTFSFNAPYGACPECTGIGCRLEVDPDLVVPDEEQSLAEGAVAPVGADLVGVLRARADGARARSWGSPWTCRGGRCPSGPRRRSCTGATTRCTSSTRTGGAASGSTPPASRAP